MNNPTITENQLLFLSGTVSNHVENLTGQPITESEDCHLALRIGEWLKDTGLEVVPSTEGEIDWYAVQREQEDKDAMLEMDLLGRDNDRLKKRLNYILANPGDPVALNFALRAPDEEIDALEDTH